MEKKANRARDIRFFSNKNDCMMTVHSKEAKKFADKLEEDDTIMSYSQPYFVKLNNLKSGSGSPGAFLFQGKPKTTNKVSGD